MNEKVLALAVMAKDDATATLKKIEGQLNTLAQKADLAGRTMGAFHSILSGIGTGIGLGIFLNLEQIFSRLSQVIPDLITKGRQWGETVDSVADATGASAIQSSKLLATFQFLGISTDGLATKMGRVATSMINNEKAANKLGITTRDANGHMLNQVELFDSVRKGLAKYADGTEKANVLVKLFGRSALEMADYFGLTDEQLKAVTDDAAKMGLVLDEKGRKAAEDAGREMNRLNGAITGLGNTIFNDIAPALNQFVSGLVNFVAANGKAIAKFASEVVNYVLGMISAITGATFATQSFTSQLNLAGTMATTAGGQIDGFGGKAKGAGQAASNALQKVVEKIKAQIEAVHKLDDAQQAQFTKEMDRLHRVIELQIRALDQSDKARAKAQRQKDLTQQQVDADARLVSATNALTSAQQQLNDAQNESPTAKADAAQRALDAEQYALDLADAQDRVSQATTDRERERAQHALAQLQHSREVALQNEIDADAAAAKKKADDVASAQQSVTDATAGVAAANADVAAAAAAQQEEDRANAEETKRAKLKAAADYLDAISTSESKWTDKSGFLAKLQADEKGLESARAAALEKGDLDRVAAIDIELQGVRAAERRAQQAIHNKERTAELTEEEKHYEALRAAAQAAISGGGGGGASGGAAGGGGKKSIVELWGDAKTQMINDMETATHKGREGFFFMRDALTEPGGLTASMEAARLKGEEMGQKIKEALGGIGDALFGKDGKGGLINAFGNIVGKVGEFNKAIGGIDTIKIGLALMGLGALTGNLPLVIAGAALAGISLFDDKGKLPPGSHIVGDHGRGIIVPGNPGPTPGPTSPTHAQGLTRVPYDMYGAFLHRDEAVLTANEADEWRGGNSGLGSVTVNINGSDKSPREIAREVTYEIQRLMTRNGQTSLAAR